MTRLIPHPLLAVALLILWLLLTQSLSPGQILLGALASLIATHGFAALRPDPAPRIRNLDSATVPTKPSSATVIADSKYKVRPV